ncbi:cell wall-binding repeat-containing protein [Rossellomorea aquimaris]|uniref:Fibronectin type-III domain-containing protein n=1 Tax=Rossellomorea aquimaris TaxID=189382 RepID=A0A5D4TNE4_9BACI|nr:cell wall-binding repeat-containing protein [Rossellomorea aquimaris]TYS75744.1 hypothetical protein FZC80_16195 [Rossellomorea aquimaris]
MIREAGSDGNFQTVIDITNELEEGLYRLDFLELYDKAGNKITYYNSQTNPSYRTNLIDLSSGNFTVTGTTADITKPVLGNIEVNQQEGSLGDTITVSVEAQDHESGVEKVGVWYDHPNSDRVIYKVIRSAGSNGKYEALIEVTDELEEGLYQLDFIELYDKAGNKITYYNSHTNPSYRTLLKDMSSGDFRIDNSNLPVNPLLAENEVVYYSQTWNKETINTDVYVGPDSTLTIDGDVTINGNVYVLGVINNYGNLKINGKITAKRYLWGSTSKSPGTVNMLGGNNSISHQVATNRILQDVPFTVATQPLVSNNGKIDIEGAVLPIVSMSAEGVYIPLNYNGTFSEKEINVGDKETLNVKFTDVFGNIIEKELPLDIVDTIDPTVSASIAGGYYAAEKEVELTMSERGEIYYTTNGEVPEKTSARYEDPITITEDTTLKVLGYDKVGNPSEVLTEIYSFLKVAEVTEKTEVITGSAKSHSTVTVTGEKEKWSSVSDENGKFKVSIPVQPAGTFLTISAIDSEGNQSESLKLKVKDVTPPSLPEVDEITDQSTVLTGSTEAGASVIVSNEKEEIGTGEADAGGHFSIDIPIQGPGEILTVIATDSSGNESEAVKVTVKDVTAPKTPEIDPVSDQSKQMTGNAEEGTTVIAQVDGKEIGRTKAGDDGKYVLDISPQAHAAVITVTSQDSAGNKSDTASVTVTDATAPSWPDGAELSISGNTGYSLTIQWPEASDNDKIKHYNFYQDGQKVNEFDASVTSTSIEGLESAKSYRYAVEAVDDSGNKSSMIYGSAWTKDVEGPEWPEGGNLSIKEQTNDSLLLAWPKASDKGHVVEYSLSQNGKVVKLMRSDQHEIRLTGLTPGRTYEFSLKAEDVDDNYSDPLTLKVKLDGRTVARLAGSSRYSTAAEISKSGWDTAETVLIARGGDFPDALAGAPLAKKLNSPILLTDQKGLSKETRAELIRLKAKKVTILGGKKAVSPDVAEEIQNLGVKVDRIAGSGRFETAAMIAEQLGGNPQKAVLTYGYNYPDALAVASYAASNGYPILLTDKQSLPTATKKALQDIKQTYIIGGRAVISDAVVSELDDPVRISGSDRYETAVNIIKKLNMPADRVYVATGTSFADALTGSVLAAKNKAPLILVKQNEVPAVVNTFIKQKQITDFTILGGKGAVGDILR